MEVAKEKMKDMVSKAREKHEVRNVKFEEKEEIKAAKSREEKEIVHQLSKARQAEAKMKYHLEKAEHRAETLLQRNAETHRPETNSVLTNGCGDGGSGGDGGDGEGRSLGGEVENAVRPPAGGDGDRRDAGEGAGYR